MKIKHKRLSTLALVMTLFLSMAGMVGASERTITFKGADEGFDFGNGSAYTDSDLFDNFKDIMPGDQLKETIQITNEAEDCDYIKLYMRAVVHDENGNPLTYSELFEQLDGKDQSGENQTPVDGQRDETVATMQDFLSKLTMRIYNGEQLIYEASPNEAGALVNNVLLGTLFTGDQMELTVKLDVPIELGNEYANRVGEVDWVFLAECFEYEKLTVHKVWDDNQYPERPESVKVHLLRNGKVQEEIQLSDDNQWTYTWEQLDEMDEWSVIEAEKLEGYEVSYKTTDNVTWITNHMDYVPEQEAKPFDITVHKKWSGDEADLEERPSSISVTLYKESEPVDKVILSDDNKWSHTWKDLDGNAEWSVLESGIPKNYVPYYSLNEGTVTITNTASLIQTGQFNWPIMVAGAAGVLLIGAGLFIILRKRKNDHA